MNYILECLNAAKYLMSLPFTLFGYEMDLYSIFLYVFVGMIVATLFVRIWQYLVE